MPHTSRNEHGPLFPPRRILTIAIIAMAVALAALGMARAVGLVTASW